MSESGNSMIKRIRKSVQFSNQSRAIALTSCFLDLYNRKKQQVMQWNDQTQ